MKVLLLNGSPRTNGCTFTALNEAAGMINENGIDTEILHVKAAHGCIACGKCRETGGKCGAFDDQVNEVLDKMQKCDGLIIGSPVYFASANGNLTSFLDRLFFAGRRSFEYKPGACVVSARRAGTTASLDQLNKYITISNMPLISAGYWCMVHGNTPEEVHQDLEGMRVMRTLGRNMAWMLRLIEAGKAAGICPPVREEGPATNFIR